MFRPSAPPANEQPYVDTDTFPVVAQGGEIFITGSDLRVTDADPMARISHSRHYSGDRWHSPVRGGSTPSPDVITISGLGQLINPGAGSHSIQFASGAADDTLVLHLGGSDQITGFDPAAGDVLDPRSLLSEAGVSLRSLAVGELCLGGRRQRFGTGAVRPAWVPVGIPPGSG